VLTLLVIALSGYLLGSFPTGYLAGRTAGVDIRGLGSGNIGATNVLRVLGKPLGYAVFVVDFAKGLGAVLLAAVIGTRTDASANIVEFNSAVGGALAVFGHTFPVWLGFKGGKGVATSIGVIFGLAPIAAVVICVVWIVTFELSRYVSLASLAAAVSLPVTVGLMRILTHNGTFVLFYFSLCLASVVIIRHRSNLARLLRGTEPRFRRK